MENLDIFQKPAELAQSTQDAIAGLWKIGAEVSEFNAPIASFFSFFFSVLFNAILQESIYNNSISTLSLARFDLNYPHGLPSAKNTSLNGENLPLEAVVPKISFLLNFSVAKRLVSTLDAKSVQIPKPPVFLATVSLLETETQERRLEKSPAELPEKNLFQSIIKLQDNLESKASSSLKSTTSVLSEPQNRIISLSLFSAVSEARLPNLLSSKDLASYRFSVPLDEGKSNVKLIEAPGVEGSSSLEAPREALVKTMPSVLPSVIPLSSEALQSFDDAAELTSVISKQVLLLMPGWAKLEPALSSFVGLGDLASYRFSVPLDEGKSNVKLVQGSKAKGSRLIPQHKKVVAETAPSIMSSKVQLISEPLKSFGYAVGLPAVIARQQAPFLEYWEYLSQASNSAVPATFGSIVNPPHDFPMNTVETSQLIQPAQMDILQKELMPSLASWVYGGSEILRRSIESFSAVPVAASMAEQIVTEALAQPFLSVQPSSPANDEMGSGSGPPHRTEEKTKAGTGSFWFPSIFPSLVASLVQGYPLLFPNIAGAKTNEKSLDIGGPYSKQSSMPRGIQEAKTFYRLPTMIALVGAENLIAAKLQSQLAAFAKETQIAQSTISEPMFEFGTATINSTPLLSELTSGAIQSYTVEPYVPSAPSLPPSPRPKTMSPTIQNAINVTLSAETAEEDLRELERKISRILSEQIGRYYGSSKF